MNEKIKLILISILILLIGSFIFLSPYARWKIHSALSLLTKNQTASVGDVFSDSFSGGSDIEEAGSMDTSKDSNWWVNSGAYLKSTNGEIGTVQGALPDDDLWVNLYKESSAEDTGDGLYPQNLFRLVNRNLWQNFEQHAYFKINAINLTKSENRNQSNGLLLFNRYLDSDNLYYTGVRVDGSLIVKKKTHGVYYTMASQQIFDGSYDSDSSPNLIPTGQWIGLKSEVVTLPSEQVLISLYTDIGRTGTWTLGLQVKDDGETYGGAVISDAGHSGIRTDFMDVSFSDYSITERDPIELTPDSELPQTGAVTFSFDESNSTADRAAAITAGITFTIDGIDQVLNNNELITLDSGDYTITPHFEDTGFTFSDDCREGKITIRAHDALTCTVAEIVLVEDSSSSESVSVGSGGGSSDAGDEIDSSLDENLPDTNDDVPDNSVQNDPAPTLETPPVPEIQKTPDAIVPPDSSTNESEAPIEHIAKKLDELPKTELTTLTGKVFYTLNADQVIDAIEDPIPTSYLSFGLRTTEVKVLQAFLAQDKEIYPEGLVTGFFGSFTERAVKKFQIEQGVIRIFDPYKFGYGKVGPNTVKKINDVYGTTVKKDEKLFLFRK